MRAFFPPRACRKRENDALTGRPLSFLSLIMVGGCLHGCQIQPIPASQLFGVSNPTLKAKVPGYGAIEIPTNFDGSLDMQKPDGTKLIITVKSDASKVVTAEGERIANMEAIRAAEFAMRLEERRIWHDTIRALAPEVGAFIRSLIPVPGGADGQGPSPPNR